MRRCGVIGHVHSVSKRSRSSAPPTIKGVFSLHIPRSARGRESAVAMLDTSTRPPALCPPMCSRTLSTALVLQDRGLSDFFLCAQRRTTATSLHVRITGFHSSPRCNSSLNAILSLERNPFCGGVRGIPPGEGGNLGVSTPRRQSGSGALRTMNSFRSTTLCVKGTEPVDLESCVAPGFYQRAPYSQCGTSGSLWCEVSCAVYSILGAQRKRSPS